MNTLFKALICCLFLTAAHAQETTPPATSDEGKTTTFDAPSTKDDDDDDGDDWAEHHHQKHFHKHGNDVVSVGRNAVLDAGSRAEGVVAVFGSAISAGDVDKDIVSVLGGTRITGGTVGHQAVAVMGSVYVNGEVNGEVVAVMGNVELGPEARVHGNITIVGGDLKKDPAAVVDGQVQNVFGIDWADFDWVRPWIQRCLLYGRPLAFSSGLGWAWGIALGLLALYVFIAFVFRGAVDKCVHTLDTEPGHSVLAALVLTLGIPVLFVLLFITVLGIAAVPFLAIALICAAMFGKVVILAAIGKRCTPSLASDPVAHTVVGVIVGGLILLVIYTIPVVGFIVYKLLELLGLGVVAYTLLITVRAQRMARGGGPGPGGGAVGGMRGLGGGPTGGTAPGDGPEAGSAPHVGGAAGFSSAHGAGPDAAAGSAFGDFTAGGPAPEPPPPPPPPAGGAASQAPLNAATLPRAGFGIRMAALLLDVILIGILTHQLHGHDEHLILLAAYGAVMWKLKGSTVGGIICGLQVVRIDGRPIDWPTAIVRALSCFLSLAVAFLGFIWIAIDTDKQAWHDKIAGTAVVRPPKGASLL